MLNDPVSDADQLAEYTFYFIPPQVKHIWNKIDQGRKIDEENKLTSKSIFFLEGKNKP